MFVVDENILPTLVIQDTLKPEKTHLFIYFLCYIVASTGCNQESDRYYANCLQPLEADHVHILWSVVSGFVVQ